MGGVLKLEPKSENEYILPHDPKAIEESVWLTVKERFSIKVRVTDEGVICAIFGRGHEDEGSIVECYALDTDTICDCPDHPWNTEV